MSAFCSLCSSAALRTLHINCWNDVSTWCTGIRIDRAEWHRSSRSNLHTVRSVYATLPRIGDIAAVASSSSSSSCILAIFFVASCGRRFSQHLNFFQFKCLIDKKKERNKRNEMRQNNLILCLCDAQRLEFYGFSNFYGQSAWDSTHFFSFCFCSSFSYSSPSIPHSMCGFYKCTVLPRPGRTDVRRLFILYSNLISWRVCISFFFFCLRMRSVPKIHRPPPEPSRENCLQSVTIQKICLAHF